MLGTMSNGKLVKSDVVIVSIKPQRPVFSGDKKLVPARLALQEWDKLDAYYRGQILKLKNKFKVEDTRKSNNNASSTCGSSHKRSLSRRSSLSGHQLTELFGDENIPCGNDNDNNRISDEENERPPDRHRSRSRKNQSSSKKSEKNKSASVSRTQKDEDEDNFLSHPRDNFVIEFAIGQKKRTPIHKSDPGVITPIKIEPYRPPVAVGFNGVHIQKILYHKSDGVLQTSPTTTATTPEKPPSLTSNSPLNNNNNNNGDNKSNGNHTRQTKLSPENVKENSVSAITSSSVQGKRKLDTHNNNNGVGSTTSIHSEDSHSDSPPKKLATEKLPSPIAVKDKKESYSPSSNFKPSLSITDKIIKKAEEQPPELKERENRRRMESQKRKAYALLKDTQHTLMDSVDVSMKALEMILTNPPLLSPIRSP